MSAPLRIEIVRAWPRRHRAWTLALPAGSTVADALAAVAPDLDDVAGYAVFGERVQLGTVLHDGDRLELLRPLQADPKEARRRRAARGSGSVR